MSEEATQGLYIIFHIFFVDNTKIMLNNTFRRKLKERKENCQAEDTSTRTRKEKITTITQERTITKTSPTPIQKIPNNTVH